MAPRDSQSVDLVRDEWEVMGRTCLGVVDASNVVHATGDEVDAVWRPGKIVDFGAYRPAHGLDSP